MTSYPPPLCFNCMYLEKTPQFIGDKGTCSKYPTAIPDDIFFKSGDCQYYNEKSYKNESCGFMTS